MNGHLQQQMVVPPSPREASNNSTAALLNRMKVFGFQTIAEAAGLKSWQTVRKFAMGEVVRPSTEKDILSALQRLEFDRMQKKEGVNSMLNMPMISAESFNALWQRVDILSQKFDFLLQTYMASHEWIDTKRAILLLNKSIATIYRMIERGEIQSRKIGSQHEFNIYELTQYLRDNHISEAVIESRLMEVIKSEKKIS